MTANTLQFSAPIDSESHAPSQFNLAAQLSWCQRAYRSSLALLIIITFTTTLSVAAVVSLHA